MVGVGVVVAAFDGGLGRRGGHFSVERGVLLFFFAR